MKKFEFPMRLPSLYIYVGGSEWQTYCDHTEVEESLPHRGEGRASENVIWIEEIEWSILFHELQHFRDFCYFVKDIPTELEYRADIASEIDTAVVQWAIEEMSGAKEA